MTDANTDPDLTEHVVAVLRSGPEPREKALSDTSLAGIVNGKGREATIQDVRATCDVLMERGRLDVVAEKGRSKRYQLVEGVR